MVVIYDFRSAVIIAIESMVLNRQWAEQQEMLFSLEIKNVVREYCEK